MTWTEASQWLLFLVIRYASSFRGVLDVDRALSASSLRNFEEALSCSSPTTPPQSSGNPGLSSGSHSESVETSAAWALGERAYPAMDWERYWERNEPLRDADEVAVPVLCVCSRDDPLLPPVSSLPLPLFQNNPYFLMALTERGGHCGFTLEGREDTDGCGTGTEEVDTGNWSHMVVLEYFKVVTDFLSCEGREGASRNGLLGEFSQAGQRGRIPNPRRRRATMMRRPKFQPPEGSLVDAEEGSFTWKRSYTR